MPVSAAIYDMAEGSREGLEHYAASSKSSAPDRLVDIGCRTGVLALLLAGPTKPAKGAGRILVEAACDQLALDGYDEVALWTLDDATNRALGFYAHLGWSREDVRNAEEPLTFGAAGDWPRRPPTRRIRHL